jgi:hypothetical protein
LWIMVSINVPALVAIMVGAIRTSGLDTIVVLFLGLGALIIFDVIYLVTWATRCIPRL